MFHRTRRGVLRRISRLDVRLGIRLALVALLAMVAGRVLGFPAFYWAGISAIVVSTGSPGGSFAASLARVGGTLVGLGTGLLAVWLLGHSLLAAALAIPLAILLCQLLGLKAAVKVSALSTLFPISAVVEAHGLTATLHFVFARAENVVLGCAVTLLMDGLLWPERSSAKLQQRIRKDIGRAGRLAAGLLEAYLGEAPGPAESLLPELQGARLTYATLLKELGSEPEDRDAPRDLLGLQAEAVHLLVDHCAALRDIQRQTSEDRAQELLRKELGRVARSLREAGQAFEAGDAAFPARMDELRAAGISLETAYEGVRGDRGTQAYPTQEAFRLLGVLYLCGALVRGMNQLEAVGEPEAEVLAEG
jgi:uncharacterized membrane protein YccC